MSRITRTVVLAVALLQLRVSGATDDQQNGTKLRLQLRVSGAVVDTVPAFQTCARRGADTDCMPIWGGWLLRRRLRYILKCSGGSGAVMCSSTAARLLSWWPTLTLDDDDDTVVKLM